MFSEVLPRAAGLKTPLMEQRECDARVGMASKVERAVLSMPLNVSRYFKTLA